MPKVHNIEIKPTTFPTPKGVFTVVAKHDIGSMKAGQTGIFEFAQMRFSNKIMVYGNFGDMVKTHPEKATYEMRNTLYFYKSLTLKECLEAFKFPLFEDVDFEKFFKDFKPEIA